MTRVLHLYGGWRGHAPYEVASWTRRILDRLRFDVTSTTDIFALDEDLRDYDLLVLGWNNALTTEDLSDRQESRLLEAVESGTGLAAFHGAAAAFRSSLAYHLVLGGSFLAHPAGEGFPAPYRVEVVGGHPVTDGVNAFDVASEQYYMFCDANNEVLARTTFSGEPWPWLEGRTSPVAWVRTWGRGRVFYHSIGHTVADLDDPDVERLTAQGFDWAARRSRSAGDGGRTDA